MDWDIYVCKHDLWNQVQPHQKDWLTVVNGVYRELNIESITWYVIVAIYLNVLYKGR